jgi:hypothetical protein
MAFHKASLGKRQATRWQFRETSAPSWFAISGGLRIFEPVGYKMPVRRERPRRASLQEI